MGMTKLHVLEVAQWFNNHSVDYWLIDGWREKDLAEIQLLEHHLEQPEVNSVTRVTHSSRDNFA
jgi:hypothetical protein